MIASNKTAAVRSDDECVLLRTGVGVGRYGNLNELLRAGPDTVLCSWQTSIWD